MDLLAYFSSYAIQANLIRRSGTMHPIPQLLAATRASARHELRFTHAITMDGTETPVEDSSAWWARQLGRGDALQQQFGGLVLTTAESETAVNAAYSREPLGGVVYDRFRFDFPVLQGFDAARLARWLSEVALAYDAANAWVHTADLLELVRTAGGAASEEPPPWWERLPPEVTSVFAALEPASKLDLCEMPEAVWWINVWSPAIVQRFGARLRSAGWQRAESLQGGYELLVASEDAPERDHSAALNQVAALHRALDLAALQRQSRV